MARIDEIAGIDPKEATKLRKAGIRTTESLAQTGRHQERAASNLRPRSVSMSMSFCTGRNEPT